MQAEPRVGGLDRVTAALEAESVPTPKENLYYAIGDMVLETPSGKQVPVRDVLDGVEATTFQTVGDAVIALRDSFERMEPPEGGEPAERPS